MENKPTNEIVTDIEKELGSTIPEFDRSTKEKVNVDNFLMMKLIGKGAYGKVYLVRKKDDLDSVYAMKILKKKDMIKKGQVMHIKTERRIMESVEHPFIIKLNYAFHNRQKLYFITKFCPGGELYYHISRVGRFNEASVKFYASQIVLALEHLHSLDIIYRDLKPENVVIDVDGYIKLTDFGLAKENINSENKANSFCGTAEYLAPEIIEREPYGKEVDWWSLGLIVYEMLVGRPAFYSDKKDKLMKLILNVKVKIPYDITNEARSFLKQILTKNNRLGSKGVEEIKSHTFFSDINWDAILRKKIKPPFIPKLKSAADSKYIDPEFIEEPAVHSYNKDDSVESKDDPFKGFSADINLLNNTKSCSDKNFSIQNFNESNNDKEVKG